METQQNNQPAGQTNNTPQPAQGSGNFKRDTAYKMWIKDLQEGTYHVQEGWKPNFLVTAKGKITRTNLMGVVVAKANMELLNYDFISIDDGTGRITVRSFENDRVFTEYQVGDVVNVIGKPREYAREIYVVPDTIQTIQDKTWLEVRKKEMESFPFHIIPQVQVEEKPTETPTTEEIIVEDVKDAKENAVESMMKLIKEMDEGSGVDVDELILKAENDQAETLIKTLLQQGDVFEIKPGRIKLL